VRIDLDVIAVRGDRLRGADLDARVAADDLGALVRAEALAIGEVARLFERADGLAQLLEDERERVASRGAWK
jgi:hypothetical protein